jgi:hypothetical protein
MSYWSEFVMTVKVNVIGVIILPRSKQLRSLRAKVSCVVQLLLGNSFDIQGECDIDL